MWKIEHEENFFRIFDSKKDIVGYFEPDYGDLYPKENELKIIEKMHKNHDKITGGFLMVPMVKFGIFDKDIDMDIDSLDELIESVKQRLIQWKNFLSETKNEFHGIRVSHTDQDMLSITFPIKFDSQVSLDKNIIIKTIEPILNQLQQQGLL